MACRMMRSGTMGVMGTGCVVFLFISSAQAGVVSPQPAPGAPLPGLTAEQRERFDLGLVSYTTVLTVADGLGPTFNQSSCGACHSSPIGGAGAQTVTRFGFVDPKTGDFNSLDELGGSLLQHSAISVDGVDCLEVIPREANHTALRVTNGMMGYGLVEAIPGSQILAHVGGAGGGVAHMVGAFEDPKGSPLRVGRFGWKAQVATVLTFSADAALNEMGLTNMFVTQENAPNGDLDLLAKCDSVPDPEDNTTLGNGDFFINRITDFQRFMAAPPQTPRSGMTGETLFIQIGCGACHVPQFTTANNPNLEDAIRNKVIRPYSDFLLHEMGALGDGIVQGGVAQRSGQRRRGLGGEVPLRPAQSTGRRHLAQGPRRAQQRPARPGAGVPGFAWPPRV
jgi:hypothetical protein